MKWNAFDAKNEFLGIVSADSEGDALVKAKDLIPGTVRVEEREELDMHGLLVR